MKKDVNIDEVAELLKKVQAAPGSVTRAEKNKLKKYLDDPEVFLRAVGKISAIAPQGDEPKIEEGTEEIIAQYYIELARIVLDKMREEGVMGLDEIKGFSAEINEDSFTIFALTSTKPVKLDFAQYVLCDFPIFKEKMMEIDALISDIITFGDKETALQKSKL
ncbi:MAG: hypothetical protein ACI4L9_02625 [Candidatus Coproplasma sp.]